MSVSGRVGAVMCMGLNMQGGREKERLSGPIQGNQINTHFSQVLKFYWRHEVKNLSSDFA